MLSGPEQDEIIFDLATSLGSDFNHQVTRMYGENPSLRIPTYCHVPSGVEFNFLVGGLLSKGLSATEERASLKIGPELIHYVRVMRPEGVR